MAKLANMDISYNERLFEKKGLRSYYHLARYRWIRSEIAKRSLTDYKCLEIGCFDGKLLDHLDAQPAEYVGIDANWENGLDLARARFGGRSDISLLETTDPASLDAYEKGYFDISVALETLEHMPDDILTGYLRQLARVTKDWLFVSVPIEIGPVFLAKHVGKSLRYGLGEQYTFREVIAATLGRSQDVARDQHKGFDYRKLAAEIGEYFDDVEVSGIPFAVGSPALSMTVGIVAKARR